MSPWCSAHSRTSIHLDKYVHGHDIAVSLCHPSPPGSEVHLHETPRAGAPSLRSSGLPTSPPSPSFPQHSFCSLPPQPSLKIRTVTPTFPEVRLSSGGDRGSSASTPGRSSVNGALSSLSGPGSGLCANSSPGAGSMGAALGPLAGSESHCAAHCLGSPGPWLLVKAILIHFSLYNLPVVGCSVRHRSLSRNPACSPGAPGCLSLAIPSL